MKTKARERLAKTLTDMSCAGNIRCVELIENADDAVSNSEVPSGIYGLIHLGARRFNMEDLRLLVAAYELGRIAERASRADSSEETVDKV